MFLTALECYWLFWDIMDYTELFYLVWASLGCSEVFLPGVGYSGLLWSIQCCSGLLKAAVAYSRLVWAVLGSCGLVGEFSSFLSCSGLVWAVPG